MVFRVLSHAVPNHIFTFLKSRGSIVIYPVLGEGIAAVCRQLACLRTISANCSHEVPLSNCVNLNFGPWKTGDEGVSLKAFLISTQSESNSATMGPPATSS